MKVSCNNCRKQWRCLEASREYPCKDYRGRKKDEKRTEMHGAEKSEPADH